MIVYRLSKEKYSSDLSGFGAEKYGGRWNSIGTSALYTASSRSLACVELAVHLDFDLVPNDYMIISIKVPDNIKIEEITGDDMGHNWRNEMHITQKLGDFIFNERNEFGFNVPSAVVQGDYNTILNPKHSNFKKITIEKIEPFKFDERLFYRE